MRHYAAWCTVQPGLSPPVKYFYWPFQGGASFVDHLCYFCLVLLYFHARLFVDALWWPAGKGQTSWLSFVMSNYHVVTFPLAGPRSAVGSVSVYRCVSEWRSRGREFDPGPVPYFRGCYVLDTQLNKVGSSSELIYFHKHQNIIRGNYDKQGVLLF